jgi:hypothetical protein
MVMNLNEIKLLRLGHGASFGDLHNKLQSSSSFTIEIQSSLPYKSKIVVQMLIKVNDGRESEVKRPLDGNTYPGLS